MAERIELPQAANIGSVGSSHEDRPDFAGAGGNPRDVGADAAARTLDLNFKALEEGFDVIPVT